MVKKSTQVALGGLAAALCLLLMFLTGIFPFATYALPALAGMVLIAVVRENGYKAAVTVYAAVSLLSVFIVPDRQAAILFIAFFGYYPILKGKLERLAAAVRWALKLFFFNAAVVLGYLAIIYLFGIDEVLEEIGVLGEYSLLVLLLGGNVVFLVYDYALNNIEYLYLHWFRPKILRKMS